MKKLMMILISSVLFGSCHKPSVDIVAEKTNTLTTGTWRFTGYNYRNAISTVTYSSLPDCRKDDLRNFKNDGTYEINEGISKCNASDPQSTFGQWKFLNDHASRIELDGKEFVVDRLDNGQFEIHSYSTDPYAPETSYTFNK